jgi:UDP-4-amino-4,6-dideoxy-N-acetyl-beta-L-altrosamine transaminase
MSRYLPYGRQDISGEELRRVRDVLESDWLTQGPRPLEFEVALTESTGAQHAIAVANGTLALYLACRAAGLGPGDKFITTPLTFVATANAAVMCGATPVFVDVEPDTLTLNARKVAAAMRKHPEVKVILPVHLGGRISNMRSLKRAADKYGAVIIEDACHAIGGQWQGLQDAWHTVGDGSHSLMTCFSFHPVKALTTGEGGAITTNDPELARQLELLRSHGITRDADRMERNDGSWYYEMHELGINARLTDLQAALGLVQLQKLERYRKRRLELVQRYDAAFADLPGCATQARPDPDRSCWHLMIVRVARRRALRDFLHERGIGTQVHYIPVHLQPYYRKRFGTAPGDCPVAEAYYDEALSLPLFPAMTDADQHRVIDAVWEFHLNPPTRADGAPDHG